MRTHRRIYYVLGIAGLCLHISTAATADPPLTCPCADFWSAGNNVGVHFPTDFTTPGSITILGNCGDIGQEWRYKTGAISTNTIEVVGNIESESIRCIAINGSTFNPGSDVSGPFFAMHPQPLVQACVDYVETAASLQTRCAPPVRDPSLPPPPKTTVN